MRPFDLFSPTFEDLQTAQLTYLPIEKQFYISVMFLGRPDDIHEEKPSFLQFKKKRIMDRRTTQRTDRRTDRPSYRDARTHLTRPTRPTMRPHDDEMIVG